MDSFDKAENYIALRRCILKALYDFFRLYPYGLMELCAIDEVCQSSPEWLNWNIAYLEKCGYVELDKSMDCPPYISCTASISAKGINLVEDVQKLDKIFPGIP